MQDSGLRRQTNNHHRHRQTKE